jgi:hypothetical protein
MLRFVIATDEDDGMLWVLPDAAGVYPARHQVKAFVLCRAHFETEAHTFASLVADFCSLSSQDDLRSSFHIKIIV